MTDLWMALTLKIEYLDGAPLIAYLTLPHPARLKSHYVRRFPPDLIVDFSRGGRPLGIEILAPRRTSLVAINRVMKRLGLPPLGRRAVAPLRAA
jgi:hypothetical protein